MATLEAVVDLAIKSVIFEKVAFQCVSSFSSCDHNISLKHFKENGPH